MKIYVPIKKVATATTIDEVNHYLSKGGVLIEALVQRVSDDGKEFRDFIQYVIGLTDACDQ